MRDHELEARVNTAMDHAAPDALDGILADCGTQAGRLTLLPAKKKSRRWAGAAVAACLALVLCGGLGLRGWQATRAVATVVSLDVNPSIQLNVNRQEKVLSAQALNEDARIILEGMDLRDAHLNVAVNAIVGSLLQHGYLDRVSSAILISVEDRDTQRASRLEAALTAEVDAALQTAAAGAAVLSQVVERSQQLEAQAQSSSISVGKAALIRQIQALNGGLAFEDLAALTVEELSQLLEAGAPGLPIGREAALEAAKAAASADLEQEFDLTFAPEDMRWDVDPELDETPAIYEVELETHMGSLEYDIDAYTGAIRHHTKDSGETVQPEPPSAVTLPPPIPEASAYIGKEAAKAAALDHAGVAAGEVSAVKCELDRDDGQYLYEVEFRSGRMEYDYEIDACTGAVLKAEKEYGD